MYHEPNPNVNHLEQDNNVIFWEMVIITVRVFQMSSWMLLQILAHIQHFSVNVHNFQHFLKHILEYLDIFKNI